MKIPAILRPALKPVPRCTECGDTVLAFHPVIAAAHGPRQPSGTYCPQLAVEAGISCPNRLHGVTLLPRQQGNARAGVLGLIPNTPSCQRDSACGITAAWPVPERQTATSKTEAGVSKPVKTMSALPVTIVVVEWRFRSHCRRGDIIVPNAERRYWTVLGHLPMTRQS